MSANFILWPSVFYGTIKSDNIMIPDILPMLNLGMVTFYLTYTNIHFWPCCRAMHYNFTDFPHFCNYYRTD